MKRVLLAWTGILLILVTVACSDRSNQENTLNEEKDIKELVQNYSVGDFEDVSASITSHELVVTDSNKKETTYELPEDEFFISIAPFEEVTHPCAIHSLTGCQGELVEKEFDVFIEDEDGNVIVDETLKTFANGFIDVWLPRNKTYEVKIEYEGKVAEQEISTFEGDNTCITTMQLL